MSAIRLLMKIQAMGYAGSISTLRRYLQDLQPERERQRKLTVRFETPPGKQMQAAWAYCARFPDLSSSPFLTRGCCEVAHRCTLSIEQVFEPVSAQALPTEPSVEALDVAFRMGLAGWMWRNSIFHSSAQPGSGGWSVPASCHNKSPAVCRAVRSLRRTHVLRAG